MARKSKLDKIKELEEQIKKMEQEKEALIEKVERNVGKMVISEWGTYDEKALLECIKKLSVDAKKLLNNLNNQNENLDYNNQNQTSQHQVNSQAGSNV